MMLLLVFFAWMIFSFYEGTREAQYYSAKVHLLTKFGRHVNNDKIPVLMHAIAFLMVCSVFFFKEYPTMDSFLLVVSLIMTFFFVRDGEYYQVRHRLDGIHPEGWFDESPKKRMNLWQRTTLFIAGYGIFVYEFIKLEFIKWL